MATLQRLPYSNVLAPEDIRLAASAFESTLQSLDSVPETASTRDAVARYIIERTLLGERDPIRLRDGALAQMRRPGPPKKI